MRAESRHKPQMPRLQQNQQFSISSLIEGKSASPEQTPLPIVYENFSKSKHTSKTPSISSYYYEESESLYSKSAHSTILDTSLHAKLSSLPHSDINTSSYPTRHQTHFTTDQSDLSYSQFDGITKTRYQTEISGEVAGNIKGDMPIFPTSCFCGFCDTEVTTKVNMVLPKVPL